MSQFDLVMYLDSDAAVTQVHANKSIDDALKIWKAEARITWGKKDLDNAAMIFFPNSPFGDWEPNLGAILFRPNQATQQILCEWWNSNDPEKNFQPGYEQSVMWKIFQQYPQTQYALNQSSTAMVTEPQFPGSVFACTGLYHISSGRLSNANASFSKRC